MGLDKLPRARQEAGGASFGFASFTASRHSILAGVGGLPNRFEVSSLCAQGSASALGISRDKTGSVVSSSSLFFGFTVFAHAALLLRRPPPKPPGFTKFAAAADEFPFEVVGGACQSCISPNVLEFAKIGEEDALKSVESKSAIEDDFDEMSDGNGFGGGEGAALKSPSTCVNDATVFLR